MGACGSKTRACVGGGLDTRKKHRRKGRRVRRNHHHSSYRNKVDSSASIDRAYCNPAFQGNSDPWFDPAAASDSECDEDYYSTHDDVLSQCGSISAPVSATVTPRFSDNPNASSFPTLDPLGKGDETEEMHNFGLLQNNCLPCLTCATSSDEKKRSPCSSPPSAKKKVTSMLSFKWREGQANPTIFSELSPWND